MCLWLLLGSLGGFAFLFFYVHHRTDPCRGGHREKGETRQCGGCGMTIA